jgi:hypothetical protein
MSEVLEETNVVSLEEFRKRHPVPSGKLLRDPFRKNRIVQDKQAKPVGRTDPQRSRNNSKLDAALAKHGSYNGAANKAQFKNKIDIFGEDE